MNLKFALLLAALACSSAGAPVATRLRPNSLAWRQFKQQHGKVYASPQEEAARFGIFVANKQLVEAHNSDPNNSFAMTLNRMADWTGEELARLNGARLGDEIELDVMSEEELGEILAPVGPHSLPAEVDWRKDEGRVSAVKDQKECGSCWAFATTGLLEGQEKRQNMSALVPLSEQELVDCVQSNAGCDGGWMSWALDELANKIGGIEAEAAYSYTAREGRCKKERAHFQPLKIKGHKMLPAADEKTLEKVIAAYGPVAVAFDSTIKFHLYERGVFEDKSCTAGRPNHAALVVGYGGDAQQGDFWLVKNSWARSWGEQGYFRIRRGKNMCGIADYATLAVF